MHQCNEESDILPADLFYIERLSLHRNNQGAVVNNGPIDMIEEWNKYKAAPPNSKVFNFFDYSFLINDMTKYEIIQADFLQSKAIQVSLNYLLLLICYGCCC